MKKSTTSRISTTLAIILIVTSLFIPFMSSEGRTIVDGIIVPEGDTLVIEDKTLFVDGDIDVEGSLYLRNVDLILNTTSTNSYVVREGGSLTIKNSNIISFEDYVRKNITLDLEPGYNLLSFPFIRDDDSVSSVLSPLEGYYDTVLFFDTWENRWKSYDISRPDHWNSLNYINRTMGVFVNVTEETVLKMEGTLPYFSEIQLNEGTNFVAFPLDEPMQLSEAFYDIIDDLKRVQEELPQGSRELHPEDYLIPGRGYKVEMHNRSSWTFEVPYGIDYSHGLNLSRGAGIGFEFLRGSIVSIEDSEIIGSGNPDAAPDFIVRSDFVAFKRTDFVGGATNILVDSSSPTIVDSNFEDYSDIAVSAKHSSLTLRNNKFNSDEGLAVEVVVGYPMLEYNNFQGYRGINLKDASSSIFENTFRNIHGIGLSIEGGDSNFEDNDLFDIDRVALELSGSYLNAVDNRFKGVTTCIKGEQSEVSLRKNTFEDIGTGISLTQSTGSIINNDIRGSRSWGIHSSHGENITIESNKVHNGSNAVRLSGSHISMRSNTISDNTATGVLAVYVNDLVFQGNLIENNNGIGLNVEHSTAAVSDNKILFNYGGGLRTNSPIWVANNTISRNELYGMFVFSGSPRIENNTFFLNPLHGIRFENSSSFVSSTSILGGRHSLHMIRSTITLVDSYLDQDSIWMDRHSSLDMVSEINLTIDEDTEFINYDLKSFLPPGAQILSVRNYDPIDVDIHDEGVDFIPPSNFHGIVNMSFEIEIAENITSWFPFSLIVNPVNDPPVIEEIDVIISDSPSKVYWLIEYIDIDGYAPTYVEIVIDGDSYTMEPVNPEDDNYADGVLYHFEMHLSAGEYSYHFVAEENNPLGENITVKTRDTTLVVPSGSSMVLDTLGEGILLLSVIILFILIIYKLVFTYKNKPDDTFGLHGEEWADDFSEAATAAKKDSQIDKPFNKLPVLEKKGEGTKTLPVFKKKGEGTKTLPVFKKKGEGTKTLPVFKKKGDSTQDPSDPTKDNIDQHEVVEDGKRHKLRVLVDQNEDSTAYEDEDEPIIDTVGDVDDEIIEDKPKEISGSIKHRKIKQEKDRFLVKKKHRSVKENGSGKKKRVLKD